MKSKNRFDFLDNLEKSLTSLASHRDKRGEEAAHLIALKAAPIINDLAKEDFESQRAPEGDPWALAKDGSRVTLVKEGKLKRRVKYVAKGTKLRADMSLKYAKYQIGKRHVLPVRFKPLPEAYKARLKAITTEVLREFFLRIVGG